MMMYPISPGDRAGLKACAKTAIRGIRGIYPVTILYLLLINVPQLALYRSTFSQMLSSGWDAETMYYLWANRAAGLGTAAALISLVLSLVQALIQYSYSRYSLRIAQGTQVGRSEELFACFSRFWDFFVLNLLTSIFTALWSLLFVIPGIVAAMAYSQAAFLLMDNEGMSALEAIRESRDMMRGHKAEYFVLLLSFLGWELLGALTAGILLIWITPYQSVTLAMYYRALLGEQGAAWPNADIAEAGETPPQDRWWEEQ